MRFIITNIECMSKSTLKKALKDMDSDGLRQILFDLYDSRPEAKEYLEFWVNPDSEKELDKYKQKIFKIFFMSEGRPRKSPGIADIHTNVKYFKSLCVESELTADLMLYVLDVYRMWLETRRHVLTHRKRVEKLEEETNVYIETSGLEERFGIRAERLKKELEDIFERGDRQSYRRWGRWRW